VTVVGGGGGRAASDGSGATGDGGRLVAVVDRRRRGLLLLSGDGARDVGDGGSRRRRLTADKGPDDLCKRLSLRPAGGLVVLEDGERALAAGDVRGAPGRAADNVLLVGDLGRPVAERDVGDACRARARAGGKRVRMACERRREGKDTLPWCIRKA
jgi:hypothetical protein